MSHLHLRKKSLKKTILDKIKMSTSREVSDQDNLVKDDQNQFYNQSINHFISDDNEKFES